MVAGRWTKMPGHWQQQMQPCLVGGSGGLDLAVQIQLERGGPGHWPVYFQARHNNLCQYIMSRIFKNILDILFFLTLADFTCLWIMQCNYYTNTSSESPQRFLPQCQTRWTAVRSRLEPLRAAAEWRGLPGRHGAPSPSDG